MTPEQRACGLIDALLKDPETYKSEGGIYRFADLIAAAITAAVDEARLEEREACVKYLDDEARECLEAARNCGGVTDDDGTNYLAQRRALMGAASAIRARSKGDTAR